LDAWNLSILFWV